MLLTDKSAWKASRHEIAQVAVPTATSSYTPVPHLGFLEEVRCHTPSIGLNVQREELALARGGAQLFGYLSCTSNIGGRGVNLAIGLRNSYDKSLSCGLVAGVQILVCSNLCFTGEVMMRRRHTSRVLQDLPDRVMEMFRELRHVEQRQRQGIEALQTRELTDLQAHDLIIQVVRAGAFPASKIPRVIREWDDPQHTEFGSRTAWSLLNAFTEVQKSRGIAAQMDTRLMGEFMEASRN